MNPLTLIVLCCIILCIGGSLIGNICETMTGTKKVGQTSSGCESITGIFCSIVCIVFAVLLAKSA
jgi:hypothetical protein